MAKWIAAEKTRAALRHAIVCPNLTGNTKERIAESKRARAGPFTLLISHKWRELVSSGRLVCRKHAVFLWCYVRLVLLRFRRNTFIGAAVFCFLVFCASICTHPDSHTQLPNNCLRLQAFCYHCLRPFSFLFLTFFVSLEMSLFPSVFVSLLILYVCLLPNGAFLRRDHGLDFLHQLI